MKNIPLHWKIIIGMVLGIVWAVFSTLFSWGQFTALWIAPFGTIFLNVLKLIAIPLVLFSVIGGIIGIGNPKNLGKLGLKTLGLYLVSTLVAVALGLLLVNAIKPGVVNDEQAALENRLQYEIWANENDIEIKDGQCYLCENDGNPALVKAREKYENELSSQEVSDKLATANQTIESGPLQALVDVVPSNLFDAFIKNSMLQIIFFAIFFGIATLYIPPKQSELVKDFINAINEVFLKMIDMVMWLAPYFVFALMAGKLTELAGDSLTKLLEIFKNLSLYTGVVVVGLLTMIFVFYPLFVLLLTGKFKYFDYFKKISPAQLLAFSTSSSAATLPVTLEVVEENLKVSPKISNFVLPIGATVNMDGTSLYQAVAAIFLAQFHLIDLTVGQQLVIVLTATMASIGSAAVPSAGLVMLMIVLTSVGLNPAWIAIILPVDRILDMIRTTVNVTGDTAIATIINNQYEREQSIENQEL